MIHADVDSFFASVHQRDDPSLRGRPVAVGPGIVMAATYEARRFGVRAAMPAEKAKRLCPELVVVESDFDAYTAASKDLFGIFRDTSPVVEGMSLEEAFLDVRGLEHISGRAAEIGIALRRRVRTEIGLPLSVGIARTKGIAKMASKMSKPEGLLMIAPGAELAFLHPIAVERLWGVGASTAAKLHARGIRTVGDVAAAEPGELEQTLGRAGSRQLHAFALGRDPRRVRVGRPRRSVGAQRGMGLSRLVGPETDSTLVTLVDRVTHRMRKGGNIGRTVILRMRFGDYRRATRSRTLSHPTASTAPILAAARALVDEARPAIEARGLTMLGITVQNLCDAEPVQLELPIDRRRPAALDVALDEVRKAFGSSAVTLGRAPRSR